MGASSLGLTSKVYGNKLLRAPRTPPGDATRRLSRSPSLAQRKYLDSLARELGYADGRAFLKAWAGTNRGVLKWTARTVHLSIDEAKHRLASHQQSQQPASLERSPGSSHQTQRRQSA